MEQYECVLFIALSSASITCEHRPDTCLDPPGLDARFTDVLSVLARRKGDIMRLALGAVSSLLPVRLPKGIETNN